MSATTGGRAAGNLLFRHSEIGSFFQTQPKLENPWLGDGFLRRVLNRLLPKEMYETVSKDLTRFGYRVCNELEPLSDECERNPPYLKQYDAWGKRQDEIVTCDAWKHMKRVTAEEGLVSIGYDKGFGEFRRLYQYAKCYLYSPSSGLYSCPIAMTDGAAKTIETLGLNKDPRMSPLSEAYERLTSRDPALFWTSGQWMTERRGGSDVGSGTETFAIPTSETGKFTLHGYKWFSSATDADMAITLARVVGPDGSQITPGSSGVSMFFVKTRKETSAALNNIHVMKLKNKLGTRQLPTGELLLDGCEAHLISPQGRGIPSITPMLTSTRLQNAAASVAYMRRILSLARDYSKRRHCFGLPIAKFPLHVNTMANLELETRGSLILLLETLRLLGLAEDGLASPDEELVLRLLIPVLKLYTAKKAVKVVSEGLELFGGQGYIEDTGIPKHFRDAQVLPIWEGTTNILSLDVLRAIGKSKGETILALERFLTTKLTDVAQEGLKPSLKVLKGQMIPSFFTALKEKLVQEKDARLISFAIGDLTIGTLLMEHAKSSVDNNKGDGITAMRWVQDRIKPQSDFSEVLKRHEENSGFEESKEIVFDSYVEMK